MKKRAIVPDELSSYYDDWKMSPGLACGDFLFLTGVTGADADGNLSEDAETQITLEAARRVLSARGRFVAYQFRSAVRRMAEPVFGPGETRSGFWNLPPMRIYTFRKYPSAR